MSNNPTLPETMSLASEDEPQIDLSPETTGTLRCQWCSVALPDGVAACPTCGSPGIPDPRLTTDITLDAQPDQVDAGPVTPEAFEDPVLWWRDEPSDVEVERIGRPTASFEEAEQRQMRTIAFIAGAAIGCTFLGWLAGPLLLEGFIENLTGSEIDNPGDLRGLGAFLGIMVGFLLGAVGGVVMWASR